MQLGWRILSTFARLRPLLRSGGSDTSLSDVFRFKHVEQLILPSVLSLNL